MFPTLDLICEEPVEHGAVVVELVTVSFQYKERRNDKTEEKPRFCLLLIEKTRAK